MKKLINIINTEIEQKQNERIDSKPYSDMLEILAEIEKDYSKLSDLDINYIRENYGDIITHERLSQIEVYKILLTGGMDFTLNEDQQIDIEIFIEDMNNICKNIKNKNDKINIKKDKEIKDLQLLIKRLSKDNYDYLKEKDFNILKTYMEALPIEEQLDTLKKIIILNGQKVNRSLSIEEHIDTFKETNLSLEEVNALFNEYDFSMVNNAHLKNTILKYGEISNMKEILDYLDKNQLLKSIISNTGLQKQICDILAFSNRDIIEKMHHFANDRSVKFDNLLYAPSNFIPSNKKLNRRLYTKRHKNSEMKPKTNKSNDYVRGSFGFFENNIIILESLGFDIQNIVNNNYAILSNVHLKEIIQTLSMYGFTIDDNFALSGIYKSCRVDNLIDKFIESDLYDYLIENSSKLNNYTNKLFEDVYYAKKQGATVLNPNNTLSHKTIAAAVKPPEEERIIDLYNKYEMEGMPTEDLYRIEADSFYDGIYDILGDDNIIKLENENKQNDFVYKIGDKSISRLKVLRIYNGIVKDNDIEIDKKQGLIFAITFNSLLNENEYNNIKQEIKGKVMA